jgi:hypothetical protein
MSTYQEHFNILAIDDRSPLPIIIDLAKEKLPFPLLYRGRQSKVWIAFL